MFTMFRKSLLLFGAILLTGCANPVTERVPTQSDPVTLTASALTPTSPATPTVARPELTGSIIIDGSSTVFPITERAMQLFTDMAPNVRVQLGVSGTGGGFKKFCSGTTDISDASRPIKSDESELCSANGIQFVEIPIAFDGISVVVNGMNTWARCMTVDELKRVWEPDAENTIMTWRQIRVDWPDEPLTLFAPGTDSGTHDYFTTAIVGEEDASRRDYVGSEDDYVLLQRVNENKGGMAYVGYAYYQEYADKLAVVAIDNGNGCVAPSVETITNATYAPLSRPIFLYVRADALDRPELRAFIEFYLDNADELVRAARYIPLPPRAYDLAAMRVVDRKTGSVFSGAPSVGLSIEELLTLEGR